MSLLEDLKKIDEIEEVIVTAPKKEKPIIQQAVQNLPRSTYQLGADIVNTIINPVTSAKSILSLGKGIIQLAIPGEQKDEKTARALGQYFANRYGGLENIKQTFAQDPAGFLADASIVLTGGATATAKVPSLAKAAETTQKIATAIDPVTGLVKGTQAIAPKVATGAKELLGVTTGVGSEAITQAVQAGRLGGEAQQRFAQNLRGQADPQDVANRAFEALKSMGSERAAQYTKGVQGLKLAEKTVDFTPVNNAMNSILKDAFYRPKGATKVVPKYSAPTIKKIEELKNVVNEFASDAAFHTAEGIDILKRKIDDLYPLQAQSSQEARVVAELRNKVKEQILKQVPEYADVMKPYEEAIKLEKQIASELSLGKKVNAGTTLRKLQSTMRDNVNTSYGNRLEFLKQLDPDLLPDLSGQALSTVAPRGLQRAVGSASIVGGIGFDPTLLATLPLQSPRLVGEAAMRTGQAQRVLGGIPTPPALPTARLARLTGAVTEETEKQLSAEEQERLEYLNRLLSK